MMRAPTWATCLLLLGVCVSGAAAQEAAAATPPAVKPAAVKPAAVKRDAPTPPKAKQERTPRAERKDAVKPDAPKRQRVRVRATVSVIDPKRDLRDMNDIVSRLRGNRTGTKVDGPKRARPEAAQRAGAQRKGGKEVTQARPKTPRQIKPHQHERLKGETTQARPSKRDRDAREVRRERRRDLRGLRGSRSPGPMNFSPSRHHSGARR